MPAQGRHQPYVAEQAACVAETWDHTVKRVGGTCTVVAPQQNVRRVFEIAGVLAMLSGENAVAVGSAPSAETALSEGDAYDRGL